MRRVRTRTVEVGGVAMGGGNPVVIQGMTNTFTRDAERTLAQIEAMVRAGARLVRVAVPTRSDTAALAEIVRHAPCPIVADVHFHYERALEAVAAGVAKLRVNPGNLRDRRALRRVIAAAKSSGAAIRIGTNTGSIRRPEELDRPFSRRELLARMLEELEAYVRFFERARFQKLVLSAKSPDLDLTVRMGEAVARRFDYPQHLGVTHAGTARAGTIKSAAALAILLRKGIGDTIRVSLAGDPVREIEVAGELLADLGLIERTRPELIVCPTCGRCQVDLAKIAETVERSLKHVQKPLRVAVMGCVVNGPGEAADADIALIAGRDHGFLYRGSRRIAEVPAAKMVGALLDEVRRCPAKR